MTAAIATLLAAVLAGIGVLHAWWALGGVWPARDKQALMASTFGRTGARRVPSRWSTVAVAVLLAGMALATLVLGGFAGARPRWSLVIGVVLGLIFLARGIAGYTPAWRRAWSVEPFATRDVQLFSPLCLAIAAGFAWLVLQGDSR